MKEIDARGLACPTPVLLVKEAIEKEGHTMLRILVDNGAARQNVCRFLESRQFESAVEEQGNEFHVIGKSRENACVQYGSTQEKATDPKKILILAATDCMGSGDDELGRKLMVNFIKTLKEMGNDLWRLVFVNNGVKLTVAGSAVLDILQAYEKDGLQILVCGTCLDHFKLLDKKQVGHTTNMLDIVTAMQLSDNVITVT